MEQSNKASTTAWWQLTLEVPQSWADDASASLIAGGALGVQVIDEGMEPLPAFAKYAVAPRLVANTRGHALLIASYPQEERAESLPQQAAEALSELGLSIATETVHVVRREDGNWAERWKQYFKPIKIGRRVWIVPTWEKHFAPPSGSVVLQLDPGMAFGTGQHATTALCLRAIEQYADRLSPQQAAMRRVLDLGCGTGILAICAAKLGLAHVIALDNDAEAVGAARENVRLNRVAVTVDGTAVDQVQEAFDLVVANILAQPLIQMASTVVQRVAPGGILVLSGILAEQADDVLRAYNAYPVRHQLRWTHGEWVALTFLRDSQAQ